jgi:hypothetical protein
VTGVVVTGVVVTGVVVTGVVAAAVVVTGVVVTGVVAAGGSAAATRADAAVIDTGPVGPPPHAASTSTRVNLMSRRMPPSSPSLRIRPFSSTRLERADDELSTTLRSVPDTPGTTTVDPLWGKSNDTVPPAGGIATAFPPRTVIEPRGFSVVTFAALGGLAV